MKTLFLPKASVRLLVLAILCFNPFIRVQAATLNVCASGCGFTDVQAAIDAAQAGDTVQIDSGVYPANLIISKSILLLGQGADQTILSGNGKTTHQSVVTILSDANVELQKLSIRDGLSSTGGGIYNRGVLTVANCSVFNNVANLRGGGIFNIGDVVVENCDIQQNKSFFGGGAIYNEGAVKIFNSAIHHNNSNESILENAFISASLGVTNTTVSENNGIDFVTYGGSVLDLDRVTVVGSANDSLNLFYINTATFKIVSSIISSESATSNCSFPNTSAVKMISLGNNVSSDGSCQLSHATDRQNAKNINLGPLQGIEAGKIPLHPLLPGSVAIDLASNEFSSCNAGLAYNDQRGVSRPQGPSCDSGAYELQVPIAHDDTYVTTEGQALVSPAPNILVNDVSPDGLPIKFEGASAVSHGLLYTNADGSFKYIPVTGFTGQDSFTYTVSDGVHSSNPATVTITVQPINHPPVAVNDTYVALAEHALMVTPVQGVLANDSDPDGDKLTVSVINNSQHGTLTLATDGSFSYVPAAGYIGDDSFTYQASDGQLQSGIATVAIQVKPYTAAITIIEDAQPDSPTNFKFVGGLGSFILDNPAVDDGDAYSNSKTFNVQPGTYTIRQTKLAGWLTADISCNPLGNTKADLPLNSVELTVNSGDNVTCTFVNQRPGRLLARVYNDLNFNLRRNVGEPWLANWEIQLYVYSPSEIPASQWTNTNGQALFSNLKPGNYTVCEVLQPNWDNLSPSGLDSIFGQPCYQVEIKPGQTTQAQFGNRPLP